MFITYSNVISNFLVIVIFFSRILYALGSLFECYNLINVTIFILLDWIMDGDQYQLCVQSIHGEQMGPKVWVSTHVCLHKHIYENKIAVCNPQTECPCALCLIWWSANRELDLFKDMDYS